MAPSEDDDTTHHPDQDPPEPEEDSPRADEPTAPESEDPTTTAAEAPKLVERFFWIDPEMDACLREAAGDEKTESEIVRELLRSHYDLD